MSKSPLQPGISLGILVGLVFGLATASLVALYLANTGAPVQNRTKNFSLKRDNSTVEEDSLPDPNEFLYGKQTAQKKSDEVTLNDLIDEESNSSSNSKKSTQLIKNKAILAHQNNKDTLRKKEKTYSNVDEFISSKTDPIETLNNTDDEIDKQTIKKINTESDINKDSTSTSNVTSTASSTILPSKNNDKHEKNIDVISEKIRENKTSPQPVNTESTAPDSDKYFVQIGAYSNTEEAKSIQNKAESQGIAVNISLREKNGLMLHRVRTKALQADEAERLRNTLKANGMEAQLVKSQ